MEFHLRWAIVGFAAASLAACAAMGADPVPQRQYTIEQFLDTESLTGNSFSADESKILFSSDRTGIFNAFTIPTSGGAAIPITRSTVESTFAVAYFPKDDRILLTYDQG